MRLKYTYSMMSIITSIIMHLTKKKKQCFAKIFKTNSFTKYILT